MAVKFQFIQMSMFYVSWIVVTIEQYIPIVDPAVLGLFPGVVENMDQPVGSRVRSGLENARYFMQIFHVYIFT